MDDVQSAEIDDMASDLGSCLDKLAPFGFQEWISATKATIRIPTRALVEMLYLRGFRKVNE